MSGPVLEQLLDYERANAWRPPAGLHFRLTGEPSVTREQVRLGGELVNDTDASMEVILFAAFLHVEPVGDALARRPPAAGEPPRPPPVPPPPLRLELGPHARVPFGASLQLSEWIYAPGAAAELAWSFTWWSEPRPGGRLRVVLP